MKRGEIWIADLGDYRPQEQMGRRPVVIWQSDLLTQKLCSVLVVPLTTNLDRASLAGTAMIDPTERGPREASVALAFQMRAIDKNRLVERIRALTPSELEALESATDEAIGGTRPDRSIVQGNPPTDEGTEPRRQIN